MRTWAQTLGAYMVLVAWVVANLCTYFPLSVLMCKLISGFIENACSELRKVMRRMVHCSTGCNLERVGVPLMHVVYYSNTKRYVMQCLHLHLLCAECVHCSPLNKHRNISSMTPSTHKWMASTQFQPTQYLVQNAHNLGSRSCRCTHLCNGCPTQAQHSSEQLRWLSAWQRGEGGMAAAETIDIGFSMAFSRDV